jgi:hypothetical protein
VIAGQLVHRDDEGLPERSSPLCRPRWHGR